mmetsp:Transcript_8518/g.27830  ORF Transcript_8518/g.27830 Transcript_8518/m.27830 type:complete len:268 (-) Transcript_8518:76-879(-)
MALFRRGIATLASRALLQGRVAAPAASRVASFSEPTRDENKSAWFRSGPHGVRAYSSEVATTMPSSTVEALKNPTANITYDDHNHDRFTPGDPSKRAFSYFVLSGGRFIYASAARLAVLKFIMSMSVRPCPARALRANIRGRADSYSCPQATKDVLALASLEVDTSGIEVGSTVTVKWRGKPVFIRHRNEDEIAAANDVNLGELRDPETDGARAANPEVRCDLAGRGLSCVTGTWCSCTYCGCAFVQCVFYAWARDQHALRLTAAAR